MAVENVFGPIGNNAFTANGVEVLHHDGKRLHRPSLALAQGADGLFISRVTAEMKTADAFDRDDVPIEDGFANGRNGVSSPFVPVQKVDFGTAVIAADGLCVVTPRFGMSIFILALRAHGKLAHARPLPVVGHGVEDRQPRAASRAVDKGMEIAAVVLVKELPLAGLADGNVRRNEDIALFLGAFDDGKIIIRRNIDSRRDDL